MQQDPENRVGSLTTLGINFAHAVAVPAEARATARAAVAVRFFMNILSEPKLCKITSLGKNGLRVSLDLNFDEGDRLCGRLLRAALRLDANRNRDDVCRRLRQPQNCRAAVRRHKR